MNHIKLALLLVTSCAAFAQQDAARPEFEVASVKPSPPPGADRQVTVRSGGPGTNSPELFRCVNLSLKTLVTLAYSSTSFQIVAPDWMDGQMFDISARVPAGATPEQFKMMLQNLLIDRFKLAVHRESRNQAKYDLVVLTSGLKMKNAAEDPAAASPRPVLPKGFVGRYRPRETMESFAAYLTSYLGKFVSNATGLKGEYEINLSWVQGDLTSNPDTSAGEPTLEHAVQDQLGLQLRGARGPVEFLVIDHAERAPTGN